MPAAVGGSEEVVPLIMPVGSHAASDPARVIVLIPAHDEEDEVPATLASLRAQTVAPDRVVVIADNCRDWTVEVALEHGVEVFLTCGNRARKAGALNQCLRALDRELADEDVVLVMDADSQLCDTFVETGLAKLRERPQAAAVGGLFFGRRRREARWWRRFLGLLQRMEYHRYQMSIARKRGVTTVLTGTASMFRVSRLRELVHQRGYVYEERSLVEDYEITLALRHLGHLTISPKTQVVWTDVMPTLRKLWHQRIRWERGALEELFRYGFSRVTALEWGRQALMALGVPVRLIFIATVAGSLALRGIHLEMHLIWMAATVVFVFERASSVWSLGPKAVLLAALLIIEMAYDTFGEAYFVRSAWLAARGATREWVTT
jgi:cellulose synthase/poly-beta-1,6-N-acetylglucosamine synthase-like glycosyltransferase